jgi:hypothetical protein
MTEHPLTKTDLAQINKGIYICRQVEQEIAALEACGFDCTEDKLRCEHLKRTLEQMQLTYPLKAQPPAAP